MEILNNFTSFYFGLLFATSALFIITGGFYLFLQAIAYSSLRKDILHWPYARYKDNHVSVIIPAYNEEKSILNSVQSCLNQSYKNIEVIIVNDGSKDQTAERLIKKFSLLEDSIGINKILSKSKINSVFKSLDGKIVLINKENSGKADSLNVGISYSSNEYVGSIDADSVLDSVALDRVMQEFFMNKNLIALGASVLVGNGSEISNGKVKRIKMPRSFLEFCQLIEYTQIFLMGRVSVDFLKSTMIVSGAFGFFKKSHLLRIGGYDIHSVGEDMDIIVRLHKFLTSRKEKYEIAFIPDSLCWTEVPSDLKTLGRQRNRWQRGLMSSLFNGDDVLFDNKKTLFSRIAIPYYILTEFLSPIFEIVAYALIAIGLIFGFLSLKIVLFFFTISILFAGILNLISFMFQEKKYSRDLTFWGFTKVVFVSFALNIGYRQFITFHRFKGIVDFYLNRKDWGNMKRLGFSHLKS